MKKKLYFLFLLVLILLSAGCKKEEEDWTNGYHIEYLSKDKNEIIKVKYEPKSIESNELIQEFLAVLCSDSENLEYRKPIPNDVEVTKYSLDGTLLTIWFDKDYNNMNEVEEVFCRAAVVRTLMQVDGVNCVVFYVDDKPLTDVQGKVIGTMNAESFVENPGEQINSIQDTTLTLYFSNKDGDGLVKETRWVHYSSNISMEKLIMEQLLEGPETSGLKSAIPAGTKLVSVSLVEGVCYVNLDKTFKNQDYTVKEPIVIYSIVNSLSEISNVSKVQISVNGDTSGAYRDSLSLSEMYIRNLDYVTTLETDSSENTEATEQVEETETLEVTEETEMKETRTRRGINR